MTPLRRPSLALAAVGLVALAFLALRPSPHVDQIAWVPHWLGQWADRNGIVRNTAAFFAVGLFYFTAIDRRWPHALALAVFATALEVAQLWIPHRIFDVNDIFASLAGLALAWLLVWLVRLGWTRWRT